MGSGMELGASRDSWRLTDPLCRVCISIMEFENSQSDLCINIEVHTAYLC
jgi:hypothetical protein